MGGVIMIYYIGCGFLLGIMTLMDDGLELALGFHAANNLIGALIVTSDAAVFQTDAIFLYTGKSTIWELLIQVFVIFPILLRSEEHTSELQSRPHLVCRLLLEK